MEHTQLTVMLASHNRADVLAGTLEAFCRLDLEGLKPYGFEVVEIVVVDNASTDSTRARVAEFAGRLPLRYLYEGRPGKNRALNKALDEVEPGELVVFTDDDVVPEPDWLQRVAEASRRHPEYSVFGGRIRLIWPEDRPIPGWAREIAREGWSMSWQDLGEAEVPYPAHRTPAGPNFWLRRGIFERGFRFNEEIGPTPDSRTRRMGSESSLLFRLADAGWPALYCPRAEVGHKVHAHLLEVQGMLRRALSQGRGGARMQELRGRLPAAAGAPAFRATALWAAGRLFSLLRWQLLYLASHLRPGRDRRVLDRIQAARGIGWNLEYLAIVRERMTRRRRLDSMEGMRQ